MNGVEPEFFPIIQRIGEGFIAVVLVLVILYWIATRTSYEALEEEKLARVKAFNELKELIDKKADKNGI